MEETWFSLLGAGGCSGQNPGSPTPTPPSLPADPHVQGTQRPSPQQVPAGVEAAGTSRGVPGGRGRSQSQGRLGGTRTVLTLTSTPVSGGARPAGVHTTSDQASRRTGLQLRVWNKRHVSTLRQSDRSSCSVEGGREYSGDSFYLSQASQGRRHADSRCTLDVVGIGGVLPAVFLPAQSPKVEIMRAKLQTTCPIPL